MKLSIVVTRFNENDALVRELLDSIEMQRGIDKNEIELIEVYDREEEAEDCMPLKQYSFPIRIYHQPHSGVSVARNLGLEKAIGDYVMFCDADDMFINAFGLHLVFQAMSKGYDLITSAFIEEQPKDGNWNLIRKERDVTFVHGKVLKREYLIRENIKFNPKLTIHEDGFFNCLAYMLTDNKYEISTPFYLWKWNPNSVVRTNPDNFTLRTYGHLISSRIALCEELEQREMINELFAMVIKTVCDSYFDFNKTAYLAKDNELEVKLAKEAFATFYRIYGNYYKEANVNDIADQLEISRRTARMNGFRVEQFTLREFLNDITK